jgi:predicted nucleic acid-binding protein
MNRYCLDTVAYSHFKRGEPRVAALIDSAEWIGVPVTVLGELFAGFEGGRQKSKNLAELDEFLSAPVVEVLPVDRRTAEIFGAIVADLRLRGRLLPTNDIWIAAAATRAGATLLTWDAHFRDIPLLGALVLESQVS